MVKPVSVDEVALGEELQKVGKASFIVAQKGGHSVVMEVADGIVFGIPDYVDYL